MGYFQINKDTKKFVKKSVGSNCWNYIVDDKIVGHLWKLDTNEKRKYEACLHDGRPIEKFDNPHDAEKYLASDKWVDKLKQAHR